MNPFAALFSSFFWHELMHMYMAGFIVVGFVVAGVYAVARLRGKRDHYHRAALIVRSPWPAWRPCSCSTAIGPAPVAEEQPTKLAAFEGLQKTTKGAEFTLGGVYVDGKTYGGITIPDMLSILAFHDPNATVQGLDAVPKAISPRSGSSATRSRRWS